MFTAEFDRYLTLWDSVRAMVRGLGSNDAPLLFRFFESLSPESRDHFRPHRFTLEGAAEVVDQASGPNGIHFLVLSDANEPMAYGFLFNLQRSSPSLGIAIADRWQNRGLGQQLMEFLIEVACRLGKEGVSLTVDDDNPRAIHVYQKTGFQLVRSIHEMRLTFPPRG